MKDSGSRENFPRVFLLTNFANLNEGMTFLNYKMYGYSMWYHWPS